MHGHAPTEGCEGIFTIDAAHLTFGGGCLSEVGALAQSLGGKRVAVFTDERVAALPFAATLLTSLESAGIDAVLFTLTRVEPSDASFLEAARFYAERPPRARVWGAGRGGPGEGHRRATTAARQRAS